MKLSKQGKRIIFRGGAIVLGLILLVILVSVFSNKSDGAKFRREYMQYNGKLAFDGYHFQKLKIKKKNKVKYVNLEEAIDILENKTGIIYFGFPNCPYCRSIVPTLLETLDKSELKELYYLDVTGIRDTYEVENDDVRCTKEASDEYYEILEILDTYLDDYIVKDENGIEYEAGEKRLYVPLVVAVQDGIITGSHSNSATLNEGQSPFDDLNETQRSELEVIFNNLIDTLSVN